MIISPAHEGIFDDMRVVWDALPRRGVAIIPDKKELQPNLLKAHLSNIGIAEHLGEGKLSFRLLGTNSREFWGRELTGESYDKVADAVPEGVTIPAEILAAIFDQPCGMKSRREARDRSGGRWLCDMLALPFSDSDGAARFLLYGYRIYPDSTVGNIQGWIPGFADLSTAQLLSAEFVDVGAGVPD